MEQAMEEIMLNGLVMAQAAEMELPAAQQPQPSARRSWLSWLFNWNVEVA